MLTPLNLSGGGAALQRGRKPAPPGGAAAHSSSPHRRSFEIVLVNDGSSDGTAAVLEQLSGDVPELVAVLLRKNYGQTAAMAAGFDVAQGEVIVSLDGDLQNDPADIPMLLDKLREGYDLVSGGGINVRTQPYSESCPHAWPTA